MGLLNSTVEAVWRAGYGASGLFRRQAGTPSPADDFWYTDIGSANHAGITVTPDIALKASALFTVVKVLSESLATLPLQMFRELGERGRVPAPEHPLDEIIRFQPNATQTAVEFWETLMLHAVLRGTGYAEIVPGRRGAVDQLLPLHTDRVKPERLPDGSLRFIVTDPHAQGEQRRRVLLQEEIFRVPGLSSDGISGLRVVDLAAEDIGLGLAADAYASRVFSNKLNIGGFLVHPGKLSPDAQKKLVQALMDRLAGVMNAHRPMVLQEGMKFERASDTAKDSQLLEARQWQVKMIAQRFRVPLHMLGIDDQTNRSTVEAQAIDFVKYTLRPLARRVEQAIRRDLIVAKSTFSAKFNMDALLRGDSASQADYFAKALGSGGHPPWMVVNEVRAIVGLNPIEGGDAIQMPVNLQTAPAAIEDLTAETRATKLVKKEIAAIRKAKMRHADNDDAFQNWVVAFYGGHVSSVMAALHVPKEVARAYCAHVKGEVLDASDLNGLLDAWTEGRPSEIAAVLKRVA